MGNVFPVGAEKWDIPGRDQRHTIAVTADEKQESYKVTFEQKNHIDTLESGVYGISLPQGGELALVSTDPKRR